VPQTGTANSWLGDATVGYQLSRTTRMSLYAAQAIVPTQFGQLQKSDSIGLTIAHDINHHSNLSFSTNFNYIPAAPGNSLFGGQSGSSEFFSASVNYGYQLTREWRTGLSYTYLQSNSTAIARSSMILFSLSRDFTLMGNPNAINQAERERARERQQQNIGYVFPTIY